MCNARGVRSVLNTYAPVLVLLCVVPIAGSTDTAASNSKLINLDGGGKDYVAVLAGPPESHGMQSGLVILTPGRSVGEHTTGQHEELLIVLQGQGEMKFADGSKLKFRANQALCCPPATRHNVTNTGDSLLRYVYLVAKATQ